MSTALLSPADEALYARFRAILDTKPTPMGRELVDLVSLEDMARLSLRQATAWLRNPANQALDPTMTPDRLARLIAEFWFAIATEDRAAIERTRDALPGASVDIAMIVPIGENE